MSTHASTTPGTRTTHTLRLAASPERQVGGFTAIDNRFIRTYARRLHPLAGMVYMTLALHADYDTGVCYPKIATLAELLGVNERSVRRQLQVLEAEGLIRVESGKHNGLANVYTLLRPWEGRTAVSDPVEEEEGRTPVSDLPEQAGVRQNKTNRTRLREKNQRTTNARVVIFPQR